MSRYPYTIAFLGDPLSFNFEEKVVHECKSTDVPLHTPNDWLMIRHGTVPPFGYKRNTFWNRLKLRLGKPPSDL